ncbi:thioredoxin-disulfide reductase [Methanocella sp. CWC-04]|uniref:Thioredoxin-disulfide reductase n=1 Tax=Methanooceanicella nereidis TaxID=2052831 RepID=A0AAP2W517_9EURY|nr:FAD-dependent oxidoreductase [Methanocella sp. CWC-04]MCD1295005.1 thioredoxin-disulfide reductase [Methanocella sp. CWC-04]
MEMLDLIIVGAGPSGMTAAIYAKRKGLNVKVISDSVGGQMSKTDSVENYPGYKSLTGPELTSKMREQMESLGISADLKRVSNIVPSDGKFAVKTEDGGIFESLAVIIASGSHWREMGVPGEEEFKNKGVSYCTTCDAPLFAGADVAVVGGGNSAGEAVLDLSNIASKVYMVVRSTIKADKMIVDKIMASDNVTVFKGYTVERILGSDLVEKINIRSRDTGNVETIDVSGVFVEIGLLPNTGFIKGLVEFNERGEIVIDEFCNTSIKGIFACGDVTDVPQKQIVVAAGEGAKAAMAAYSYITTLK